MKKVEEQRKLLEKTDPPVSLICSEVFTKSYGLHCVHKIKSLQEENRSLSVDDFHRQWHLKRNEGHPQLVLEPVRVESRVPQSSTIAQTSTQREPSTFERLEKRAART
jgi:hypothetical protein